MSLTHPVALDRTIRHERSVRADAASGLSSARRTFIVALGLIWLLDAALQYQPYMFSTQFVSQIIGPTTAGNPGWIAASETWASGVMIHHIVIYNTIFASIQLVIAVAILWPRSTKVGLAVSIVWAVGVWWFGEGLGGIFNGASPLAGVPGGVILYAFIAITVWPTDFRPRAAAVATSGPTGRRIPRFAWIALWGSFAYSLLIPANRAPESLHAVFASMARGEPAWLASIDRHAASALVGDGSVAAIILAICSVFVAGSMLTPVLIRPGIVLAVSIALFLWLAENFGAIFTGSGTDPNSGLPLVLLALTFWPLTQPTAVSATRKV